VSTLHAHVPGPRLRRGALALLVAAALAACPGCARPVGPSQSPVASSAAAETLAAAFRDHTSGVEVSGSGAVIRVLADDNDGSRHQRFILRLESGQTLLFAHNIDIAPRLDSLKAGDVVEFSGIYEWNDQGGLVHWTHRDPGGQHPAGWLRLNGRTYQ
jgi:hypothetical protein